MVLSKATIRSLHSAEPNRIGCAEEHFCRLGLRRETGAPGRGRRLGAVLSRPRQQILAHTIQKQRLRTQTLHIPHLYSHQMNTLAQEQQWECNRGGCISFIEDLDGCAGGSSPPRCAQVHTRISIHQADFQCHTYIKHQTLAGWHSLSVYLNFSATPITLG